MNTPILMDESAFHARVEATFASIEAALDADGSDIDSEISGGILTLEFENDTKVIVDRVFKMLEVHTRSVPSRDDLTLVVVRS